MDTPEFSSHSRTEVSGGQCKGADTIKMTASGRQIFDIPQQSSACTDQILQLGASCHDLIERLAKVEQEVRKKIYWEKAVDLRLQYLESCQRELLGEVTHKELQEKEEYKKLKERNKELEARNKELLSKAMSMHKHSENMNDPLRLTAVLEMYEMLRLHEWEKLRCSSFSSLSYKAGSSIIKENTKMVDLKGQDQNEAIISIAWDDKATQLLKNGLQCGDSLMKQFMSQKVFDACEKDIQQRTTKIFEVLDITPLNDAMTNSKQEMMKEIRNLFRYSYSKNQPEFYSKIITDPPVEAVWNLHESSMQYLEHVDKKDWEHWRKPVFLWPILKQGEQIILKGVVWDEK